jgi:hypothetical protein
MLLPTGEVPVDIVELLELGDFAAPPEYFEHLWLDRGATGEYCWRLDNVPVYVIREEDGTLHKGSATY